MFVSFHPHKSISNFFKSNKKTKEKPSNSKVSETWDKIARDQTLNFPVPKETFGCLEWEQYLGKIGQVPPLPENLKAILEADCPFWDGKKVKDTHMLVLIPQTVNDNPYSLNSFKHLVKQPLKGNPTKYRLYADDIKNNLGNIPVKRSYWILITKEVIPNSCNKTRQDQIDLVKRKNHYNPPTLLEASTSILTHFIQTKEQFFSDNPWTYTTCQENFKSKTWVVGGLNQRGLYIHMSHVTQQCGIAGCRRI